MSDHLVVVDLFSRVQGEDNASTSRVISSILKVIHARKDWKMLNSYLLLLSKRRGQLKGVCVAEIAFVLHLAC
jgi:hypothetical protein